VLAHELLEPAGGFRGHLLDIRRRGAQR